MSKRLSFYGLVGLASLCIFFLAFNQRYSGYLEHRLQPVLSVSKIKKGKSQKHEIAEHSSTLRKQKKSFQL